MSTLSTSLLRILVVEDHELTRYSLKLAFARQAAIEVVGLAKDGREAISMVERYQPDLVVMDLHMPGINGWEASKHIKNKYPHIKIVAYSAAEGGKSRAIAEGATIDAFCDKGTHFESLLNTIKSFKPGG